jgi:hypothetical protein
MLISEEIEEWEKLVTHGVEGTTRITKCLRGHEIELELNCGFQEQ